MEEKINNTATKLTWQCNRCKDIVISYSNIRWNMDGCKCGQSGVDLERWYQRNFGYVKELKREIIDDIETEYIFYF